MKTNQRIAGFDFARSLAIFGMILVHFKILMSDGSSAFMKLVGSLLEGRAAAVFVLLAGIGVSLMTAKARESKQPLALRRKQQMLLKRVVLLLILGFAFAIIWPADILHYYGVYMLAAIGFLAVKDRTLLWGAAITTLMFPILLMIFDYEQGWHWETLEYSGFWTLSGQLRNLFFNGFHPFFPWFSFILIGLYLGRLNWRQTENRKKLAVVSALLIMLGELPGMILRGFLVQPAANADDLLYLFGSQPIPPMPFYILSASGVAILVILFSIWICERFSDTRIIKMISVNGQMALTVYVGHVVVGMGLLELSGNLHQQSTIFILAYTFAFYALTVVFSWWWMKRYSRGPLEWLFRRLSSGKTEIRKNGRSTVIG